MTQFNVLPLLSIPQESFPLVTSQDRALRALRDTCQTIEGYFVVRDTLSTASPSSSTFTLENSPSLNADIQGNWYLGRIHLRDGHFRISISVDDPLFEPPNRTHAYQSHLYTPKDLMGELERLHTRGSKAFLIDNYLRWHLKRSCEFPSMYSACLTTPLSEAASQ